MSFLEYACLLSSFLLVSFLVGYLAAFLIKLRGTGWKIGLLILAGTLPLLFFVGGWPPRLGVDLKGGNYFIFQIYPPVPLDDDIDGGQIDINLVVRTVYRRIDPLGTENIEVRALGNDQVEIITPEVDQKSMERYLSQITKSGFLQFRIIANSIDHKHIMDLAREQQGKKVVIDEKEDFELHVGRWVRIGRDQRKNNAYSLKIGDKNRVIKPLKVNNISQDNLIRDFKSKEIIPLLPNGFNESNNRIEDWLERNGHPDIEILVVTDDHINLQGKDILSINSANDGMGNLEIDFVMKDAGAIKMGQLTRNNLPVDGRERQLGVMLDNELLSAPGIQSRIDKRGRIMGRFTKKEIDFIIQALYAGRLPIVLDEKPVKMNRLAPSLGALWISKIGISATLGWLLLVAFVMLFRYRSTGFAGVISGTVHLILIVSVFGLHLAYTSYFFRALCGSVFFVSLGNLLICELIRRRMQSGLSSTEASRKGFWQGAMIAGLSYFLMLIVSFAVYLVSTLAHSYQYLSVAFTFGLGNLAALLTTFVWLNLLLQIVTPKKEPGKDAVKAELI